MNYLIKLGKVSVSSTNCVNVNSVTALLSLPEVCG